MPSASRRTTSDDLRVGLQADDAVHDVGARLLEGLGPLDVALLVEPRRELDERHHLLAGVGRADRARRRCRLSLAEVRYSVCLIVSTCGVVGRLRGGTPPRCVAKSRRGGGPARRRSRMPAKTSLVARRRARRDGRPGSSLSSGRSSPYSCHRAARSIRPSTGSTSPVSSSSSSHQEVAHLVGCVGVDLEANRVLRPAAFAQQGLDGAAEVEHLVLAELRVLVPRDPEQRRVLDVHPREQRVEVRLDDAFDRTHRRPSGSAWNRASSGGTLIRANRCWPPSGSRTIDGDVQRQVRDVGERVRRVHRERREHREDLVEEHLAEGLAVLVGELVPADTPRCPPRRARGEPVRATRSRRGRPARGPVRGSRRAARAACGRPARARGCRRRPVRRARRRAPGRTRRGWSRRSRGTSPVRGAGGPRPRRARGRGRRSPATIGGGSACGRARRAASPRWRRPSAQGGRPGRSRPCPVANGA